MRRPPACHSEGTYKEHHVLPLGSSLDREVLVETIREGGMGVVRQATDSNLPRGVAIKVLPEGSLLAGQENANEKDPTQVHLVFGWVSVLKKKPAAK